MRLNLTLSIVLSLLLTAVAGAAETNATWSYGLAQAKITPAKLFWMGGFAARTRPAEGTLDDLWVRVLALGTPTGQRAVFVTADFVGIPKWLYDRLSAATQERHGLDRSQVRFAASHTHSGPVLTDALSDIYPLDDEQRRLIAEYSSWLERTILETVSQALASRNPATLWAGESKATFAFNRRTNNEADLAGMTARGEAAKGPSDSAVPVLALRSPEGPLRVVVFGYAAHTSALTQNYLWSADYAGVTRRVLEQRHPGVVAMFFQGCGSDQSAVPRGTVERCQALGESLAAAVDTALERPMRQIPPAFRAAFEFVSLEFEAQPTLSELETLGKGADYSARWARRLAGELAAGKKFENRYPEYPVQVWRLGTDQLWIALGGEVCVDYALRFKKEFGPGTWVTGYANDVMAYIPSRRLWEEGGYQAGAFEVYGLPASRWCADIEDRIAGAVNRLVAEVQAPAPFTLITLDPGHFHAALFQRQMLPGMADEAFVYAPPGPDLTAHLNRIAAFNARQHDPTRWHTRVCSGPDFFERMLTERRGQIVVMSGRNRGKMDRIRRCINAGLHVLADKPWIIREEDLPALQAALDQADARNVISFDAMTQRFEVTAILQRALVNDPDVFGVPLKSPAGEPAVVIESLHYLLKEVSGVPNLRPPWFFDIAEQGEGLADVGTHLVDMVQWVLFPDTAINYRSDIQVLRGMRWPTELTVEEFRRLTGQEHLPDAVSPLLREGKFDYFCNNSVDYALRGIPVRVRTTWDFAPAPGQKDTECVVFRGSRACVEVRQDPEDDYRREVYVVPAPGVDRPRLRAALEQRLASLQKEVPGVSLQEQAARFRVVIPPQLRAGHEEHFGRVVACFLDYARNPKTLPAWEKPNMMAKYYITTRGVALARQKPARP